MEIAKISTIAIIGLLGAMSPGPDFAIVTKNSLSGDFRKGALCALGIVSALMIHLSYCIFGIALIILESPAVFYILKYLGAGYLFYLGIKLLKEKKVADLNHQNAPAQRKGRSAYLSGFLCNLLNPKCTLFMLSLFTQFIDPSSSLLEKTIFGGVIFLVSIAWFLFLAFFVSHHLFQRHFARFQFRISQIMGIGLCLLALFVALSPR